MTGSGAPGDVTSSPNPARAGAAPHPSLADWMTIAHGLCGFVALAVLAHKWHARTGRPAVTVSELRVAGTLVAAGCVLDLFDGPVARRLGSSGLGDRLDGMCDTVTCGVVPAVLVAASGDEMTGLAASALIAAGGIYLTAMILRLVRTEVTSADVMTRGFQGLPSAPASSATLAVVALGASPAVSCVLVLAIAVLVVVSFRYPRQRPALMPIMAGGPAIGLLGVWGVLPLKPVAIVAIAAAVLPWTATAGTAWRHRKAGYSAV